MPAATLQLLYEFGTTSGGVWRALTTDAATSFTFKGLPVGTTTIYICAVGGRRSLLPLGAAGRLHPAQICSNSRKPGSQAWHPLPAWHSVSSRMHSRAA
jgi:hypothetical protein